jgi:GNAT superfamily N-acetyltransferase
MAHAVDDFSFRPVHADHGEFTQTVDFLRLVWPGSARLNALYLRWLYYENPAGPVIGMNAWSADRLVGHYVVVPIATSFRGHPTRAALSLNTAVHPDFRGRGLFTRLAEATYAIALQQQIDHVVGVANNNSTAGFVRSLGFQLVSPLAAYIFVKTPKLRAEYRTPTWQRIWNGPDFIWRLRNPSCTYTYQVHGSAIEINGPTPYTGLKSALNFILVSENGQIIQSHLHQSRQLQPRLWIGLSSKLRFGPLTAFSVPDFMRRAPLNLIYRSLSRPGDQLPAAEVEFSGMDFDVV